MKRAFRRRPEGAKVWHNPELVPTAAKTTGRRDKAEAEERSAPEVARRPRRNGGRVVVAPTRTLDPKEAERERMLERLLESSGRPAISAAANALVDAGHELPTTQEVLLQLLEHRDEGRIRDTIDSWNQLLTEEEPKRRAVLESRLKRIAELADEEETRMAARRLFRRLTGRPDDTKAAVAAPTAAAP